MRFAQFLHLLGQALWIGGGIAAMTLALATRGEDSVVKAGVYRLLGRVHGVVIAPGALITVLSGLWLTMTMARRGRGAELGEPGLAMMQGLGIVAGILVLFIALPTANLLSRVAEPDQHGQLSPLFERLRKRQAVVSSVAGGLALLALLGAVL
ncbi:MAG: hypothetical protein A3K13_12385 [Gemmatimonadetes bacterium RIFCSPLOWO2_12_FULL_68_9]|nr:MAG: hypothetical protein A3K13_12385 [Gemmatimonadetes bacterium RIFCSPLOWO2_12_FULL_68_9]